MSVPNVNFFIGYALPESRKDILEGKEKSTDYTDAIRIHENFIYMEESNDE